MLKNVFHIFKLKGFWPSEYKKVPDKEHYYEAFSKHGFHLGRMISASKSGYCERYPDNLVVFNANVVTEKADKVWYGDLDVTRDFEKLKDVANELNEDLYVVREMDGRFEREKSGFKYWKSVAVATIKAKPTNE